MLQALFLDLVYIQLAFRSAQGREAGSSVVERLLLSFIYVCMCLPTRSCDCQTSLMKTVLSNLRYIPVVLSLTIAPMGYTDVHVWKQAQLVVCFGQAFVYN